MDHPVAKALSRLKQMDWLIVVLAAALAAAGYFLTKSAGHGEDEWHLRQLRWYGAGVAAAIPVMLIPYPRLLKWAVPVFLLGLASLLLVLKFGVLRNSARRWFVIGGANLQPSEFMKPATVLFIARWLRLSRPDDPDRRWTWLQPLALVAIASVLILKQPDLGTSLLFVPVALAMAYAAGAERRDMALVIAAGMLLALFSYQFVLRDYQRERISMTYRQADLTPAQRAGPGFQLTRSLAMIAGGGLSGQGYMQGPMTQAGALPEQHNDFIFSSLAEEHGFIGGMAVILLCAGLFFAILRVAATTRDPEGRLICVGVAAFYGLQSLVEFAVALGLAPTTGMPLPLVSYGGSSFLVSVVSLALVQNVAIHRTLVSARR